MSFLKKLILTVITVIVVANTATAVSDDLYFTHFDNRNGLSQNTINCIIQDQIGFIWIGTKYGLNRFDGIQFRQFPESEVHNAIINTLYEDASGNIWIGTDHGVFTYEKLTDRIQPLVMKGQDGREVTNGILQITKDSRGRLVFIVDNDGIYTYDIPNQKLERQLSVAKLRIGQFHTLQCTDDGQIWISVYGHGLWTTNESYAILRKFVDNNGLDVFENTIISAIRQHNGKLYVGTESKGVYEVDPVSHTANRVFPYEHDGFVPYVREIMFYDNNDMWIGTENGIYTYNLALKKTAHYTHNPLDRFTLADNVVYALTCDRDGGVWIGSYFGGVNYSCPSRMKFKNIYKGTSESTTNLGERIRELCVDANGKIWIGTEDDGISSYNPSTGAFQHVAESSEFTNVHGLHIDNNRLWIGTFAKGLKIMDINTGKIKSYTAGDHGLASPYIFSIIGAANGDIYLGTMSGLQRYDRSTDSFITEKALNDIFIYDLLEDSRGDLWVATYVNGVYRRDGASGSWTHFSSDPTIPGTLPSNNTFGLYEDLKGTIWVMTQHGLCSFDTKNNRFDANFETKYHITDLVFQIIEDDYGKYWLTTNNGLYSVNSLTGAVHHYTSDDGLITNAFNYKSSLKTSDGTIYLGTTEGLVCFKPRSFQEQSNLPKPTIVDMLIHGKSMVPLADDSPLKKSIFMSETIHLKSHQNTLAFRLATLKYNAPTEQNIKYQLKGFDKDWQYYAVNNADIRYANLTPGTYTLCAAIFNDNPDECSALTELKIVIDKPFYQTVWAYCLYVALVCVICYIAMKYYRDRYNARNERNLENIRQKEQSEAYDSKIKFFTNVAHEIRTPLTLIKAPLDCIFQSKVINDKETRENLDVINLNVNRLLSLANQLLDFRKIENGKFQINREMIDIVAVIKEAIERFQPTITAAGIKFNLELTVDCLILNSDKEAVTKIFSNLLTNAVKYSDSYIRVTLEQDGDTMVLSVVNDGEPVKPDKREFIFNMFTRLESSQPGTGIGLSYARSLANMLDGSLAMGDSLTENQFILRLPIKSNVETAADNAKDTDEIQNIEHILRQNEKSLSIMLVEDNVEMLTFLEKKLIANNYRVIRAANGEEALRLLKTECVDIMISDVMMPVMDGYELTKAIKNDVKFSHIPIILLTAKTRMEDKLTGLKIGASAYIEKPFAIEYLLATINSIVANRELLRLRLEKNPVTRASGSNISKVDEEFLSKLNDIIHANFDNPEFSIDDVIDQMGIGRTTFYRKIKGLLDLSPYDYIRIERLKRAASLFADGHTNVSEVCYMVGFSSPGYFSKCFQKQFGLTPKEYIAHNKSM